MDSFIISAVIFTVMILQVHAEELEIEIRTLSEVKACYYDSDRTPTRRGCCVRSTPSSVHVKTLKDEVILGQEQKASHSSLRLGDQTFIKYNDRLEKFHRLTSRSSIEDGGETEEAKREDLEKAARVILEHEDIDLLERMARALGSAGLYGHENPSILPFYTTAKRFSGLAKDIKRRRKRDIWTKITTDPEITDTDDDYVDMINSDEPMIKDIQNEEGSLKTHHTDDAIDRSSTESQTPAKNSGPVEEQPNKTQPSVTFQEPSVTGYDAKCPPNFNQQCLGLCGYGCDCWKFLCGDCCWHKGCYQHDMCCRKGLWTWACLMPFTFSCDEDFSSYPACLED